MKDNNIWSLRASNGLGAGIDPNGKLIKNKYIDFIHKKYIKNIFKKMSLNYDNILDFGCGNGRFSFFFSLFFKNVIGIDLSKKMILNANNIKNNKNINNITFINNNILNQNFDDIKFNTIFTSWCLQHILDENILNKIIQKFYKIIHKNGYIIIIEQTNKKYSKEYINNNHYKDLRTKDYYIKLFKDNGFNLISIIDIRERTYGFFSRLMFLLPNLLIFLIPIFFQLDKFFSKFINGNNKQLDSLLIFKKGK